MRFSLEALDSGLDDLELQDPSPSDLVSFVQAFG